MSEGSVVNSPPDPTGGGGEVTSLGTAGTNRIAVFTDGSGDEIKDSEVTIADLVATAVAEAVEDAGDVVGPASAVADRVAVYNSTSGKLIKDGGQTIAQIIAAASAAPPPGIAQNSFLISGGDIIWVDDYDLQVSPATYMIGGVQYTSPLSDVSLDTAHATLDRIDVVAVTTSGTVVVITGTAATQPVEPEVDIDTQLKLRIVLVTANTTEIVGVTTAALFEENAGSPTEWDWTTSGSGFNVNSSSNPRTGSKSIEGTAVAQNAYAQAQFGSSVVDPNTYDTLILYIKSKATWASNRRLRFQFFSAGTPLGTGLLLGHGTFGFDSSNTSTYQLIVLPISQFAVPVGSSVNQLRVTDTNGAIGFYLDDVALQSGFPSQAISALTLTQADARYAPLSRAKYFTVGCTLSEGGEVLTARVHGRIQVHKAGTIVGWSIVGDLSGSVSVDVCKKAGTQLAPAVPNTTTDKISASAPIALSSEQAKGVSTSGVSTWSTAVAQWDTMLFNVTGSPATITEATLFVLIQVIDP